LIAVDEDRFGVTPAGRLAAEGLHALRPNHFPVGDIHAGEIAFAAQRENFVAIDTGRAARAAAPAVFKDAAERSNPQFLAGVRIERDQDF
jgi:hypothetical protein